MGSDAKSLLSLPDEVISEVLSYCDVEDLLHVEQVRVSFFPRAISVYESLPQTCKRLQKACQGRDVWRSQLQALDIDTAPYLPPFHRLATMTASSLKDGAVTGVRTRDLWRNPRKMKIVKEDEINFTEGVITRPMEPRRIPGGDEVLLGRSGKLEIWSLATHQCIWTAPSPPRAYFCTSVDFDVVGKGREVMIACEFSSPDDMPESRYDNSDD